MYKAVHLLLIASTRRMVQPAHLSRTSPYRTEAIPYALRLECEIPMSALILLVDDNPVQAMARQAILMRSGAEVVVARSAEDALLILENAAFCGSLGLMVTDHIMPGMNGAELTRRVRQVLPMLPILVLSGLADAEGEYNGTHVLFRMKPFPPTELIQLVQQILVHRVLRTA